MVQWVPQAPVAVNLRRLFPSASFVGCGDIRILYATCRSAECRPNGLFAVIRGTRTDGHKYIQEAIARGATALLVDHPLADVSVPQCIVPDVRRAFAELCAALAAHPSRHLGLAGVTGTNGKTTTTWLIRSILHAAAKQTGLLGTIDYSDGVTTESSTLTTPDAEMLSRWLSAMVSQRTTHAAMEVSSHALDQRRLAGTLLDAAVITNITQDHFDYHQTYEAYRRTKLRMFDYLKPAAPAIINLDDEGSRSCLADAPKRVMTYGLDHPADVNATILEETLHGSRFRVTLGNETQVMQTRLVGRHNVSNCLAAIAVASHFNISLADIAQGVEILSAVPGRLEQIDCGQQYHVFVDYAHTEDALRRCVQFLRPFAQGRLICVFGAGGDRDKAKRPLLGKAANEADVVVVTSDNPRSEDPQAIIQDILAGIDGNVSMPHVEVDRQQAIHWALERARPGDIVLVAGKGHETEQIIGTDRNHFDDREVVRRYLGTNQSVVGAPHNHLASRPSISV